MPLYLRTQYIIESKNKKLEELRNSYKLNLSTSPKKEITEEKRLKTLSYSVERFYENQIQWSSKIKKENVFRKNFLEINNKDLIECKFHPELSEGSLEIIRTINYKNNINEKKNNESIYEKLYKEKDEKEKKEN